MTNICRTGKAIDNMFAKFVSAPNSSKILEENPIMMGTPIVWNMGILSFTGQAYNIEHHERKN